ncbi:hypothetical protein Misp01_01410 [Microtetraspora sp. NBRC 13810]|uniref:WXG100 family type VII secretion target n=1 Tax=Microtetraspora sp. NBRC 13810 TaxID=3030990 RepID=UPI0024A040A4|nr:WXG100 family type VII secretion target [Microtetraspora sp. NBRC 13810]GLW05011.1 hypothetical protein Misp01_01410 [Microtetraspora sp. NBRC 13810]
MTEFFGAKPEQITQGAQLVEDTAQYVEGLRKGVQTLTSELTSAGWLGSASAKFVQAMVKWDEQAMIVRRDLETIAKNMGDNVIVYRATEADVQSGMNRVDSLINSPVA